MDFIKIMLYSRQNGENTTKDDKIFRAKYTPWNNIPEMSGAIEFVHNNNHYKLQKKIDNNSVLKDVTELLNLSTGEILNLGKKQEVGEYLFNIDLKTFERTSFIKNLGSTDFEQIKDSNNSLTDKIINFSLINEDETSTNLIIERINNAIKDLERNKNKNGKIPDLNQEINCLLDKIYNFKKIEEEQLDVLNKIHEIEILKQEHKYLKKQLENYEINKKILLLKDLLNLVLQNENLAINLPDIKNIKKLKEIYRKIELCECKISEFKEKLLDQDGNLNLIFNENLIELETALSLKQELELESNNLNLFLENCENNTYCFEHIDNDLLENYKKYKLELTSLQNLKNQVNLNINENSLKKTFLENDFNNTKKVLINSNIISLLVTLFLGVSGVYVQKFSIISLILLCVNFVFGVFNTKNKFKKIRSIKKELEEIDLQIFNNKLSDLENKILNLTENLNLTKTQILNYINKKVDINNKNIFKILNLKHVDSVQEYYQKYAHSENMLKNQNYLDNLKEEFVNKIFNYKKINDYFEAELYFNKLVSNLENLDKNNEKIEYYKKILDIKYIDTKNLKDQINKLTLNINEQNILSEFDIQKVKEKIQSFDIMNLDEIYLENHKKLKSPDDNIHELNKKLDSSKEKLLKLENYLKSLEIAKNILEECIDDVRKQFCPELNNQASLIFKEITSNKYDSIYIPKDYKICINYNFIDRNFSNFSSGTIDQAYLSMRIAMANLISNNIPLILDDIFVRYDTERFQNTLNFLKNFSKNTQIILFTCHDYIMDIFENSIFNKKIIKAGIAKI